MKNTVMNNETKPKARLTINDYLLSVIIVLLSVIGYFYIQNANAQITIDNRQTENIDKLLEISNGHNTRLTRVETKIGLY